MKPQVFLSKICQRIYRSTMRWEAMPMLAVRRKLLDIMLGRRHNRLNVFPDVHIDGYSTLALGEDVSINRGCHLSCSGGVTIGNFVSIGHSTSILSTEHQFDDARTPIKYQPIAPSPVKIGSNVWIGSRVTILAGVSIADGTVVGAGAVVTRSVDEHDTIIGGVPARKIKDRLRRPHNSTVL